MNKKKVSAVILAGGNSSRMGQNKALLKIGSKTIIEKIVQVLEDIFEEIIIVTNTPQTYEMLNNVRLVPDAFELKEKNSIIGLYTGILEAKNTYSFVVACDMPSLNPDLIKYMVDNIQDEDIMVPYKNDYYQPLHAIYSKKCLKNIKKLLEEDNYKISKLYDNFDDLNIKTVDHKVLDQLTKEKNSFLNVNTYEEYLNIKDK